ncbi:MAG: hypothetical protein IJT51_05955, partial [Bacteroidales bacterium]|nr:hypothetical protein [Bacteroidales bacterium]
MVYIVAHKTSLLMVVCWVATTFYTMLRVLSCFFCALFQICSIIVNKISGVSGEPLQGAKFRVTYRSNNTETGARSNLGNFLTDVNGQFRLTDLTDGWYTITELESVAGYSIREAVQEVYI